MITAKTNKHIHWLLWNKVIVAFFNLWCFVPDEPEDEEVKYRNHLKRL